MLESFLILFPNSRFTFQAILMDISKCVITQLLYSLFIAIEPKPYSLQKMNHGVMITVKSQQRVKPKPQLMNDQHIFVIIF